MALDSKNHIKFAPKHPTPQRQIGVITLNFLYQIFSVSTKQAIRPHERALCQLTVWFEFQSRSQSRDRQVVPAHDTKK